MGQPYSPNTIVVIILSSIISYGNPSMNVSYCDIDGSLVTLDGSSCSGGVNFGQNKPSCICISGIYRLWMDNCVVYDGFMNGGCSTLDVKGSDVNESSAGVTGLRLTIGFEEDGGDWTHATAAVFSLSTAQDYDTWKAYGVGSKASTSADNFYTSHGVAFVFTSTSPTSNTYICVERKVKKEDEICRYFREDNSILWGDGGIAEIRVEEECVPPFGDKKVPLVPGSCYNIMTRDDSECTLSCVEKENFPTFLTSAEDTNNTSKVLERRSPTPTSEKGDTVPSTPSMTSPQLQTLSTNFFLNRKLNHYSKLRQVGYLKPHDLTQIPPTRTFQLFEIIREIGKRVCSGDDKFVSSLYIDQAVDLFVLLHKGRNYRYTEDLGGSETSWIRTILGGCLFDAKPLPLSLDDSAPPECTDLQRVDAVCVGNEGENCTRLGINPSHSLDPSTIGAYHLVVEAAWDLVDLAQAICFPAFAQSYRMLHQWEQVTEKLFTREIRKLWHNPGLSMKAYQSLLTPSAEVDAHNLEMCVEGAYALNPPLTRLVRPPEPRKFFRRRKRDTLSQIATVSSATTTSSTSRDVYCRIEEGDFEYPC